MPGADIKRPPAPGVIGMPKELLAAEEYDDAVAGTAGR
jgi:hypothetical protein